MELLLTANFDILQGISYQLQSLSFLCRIYSFNFHVTSNKFDTYIVSGTQQIVSPTISEITLPKKKHKASPAGNSADDSAVEIHWDNNSPTSQALRPKS